MFVVGLTGGIASGKSLVAHALRDLGVQLIDADRIVHCLLEPNEPAWQEVRDHFGASILLPNERIDRKKLGEIVFTDDAERAWLNACLHPRVFDAYLAQIRNLHNRPPDTIVVFDAALLVETGYHKNMDRLVVVFADPEQQLERLTSRDGLTPDQAMARIASQMPLAEKRVLADYIIDNTGSREETKEQVKALYSKLAQEAAGCS